MNAVVFGGGKNAKAAIERAAEAVWARMSIARTRASLRQRAVNRQRADETQREALALPGAEEAVRRSWQADDEGRTVTLEHGELPQRQTEKPALSH
ncbi:MAG TPA: hypothetical protein VKV73_17045 [Chloroflexota bacterium]|nr:hypothetical protein [Chloroflexota bacterium]